MKVGDIVRQCDKLVVFKGKKAPKRSELLGTVVAIHDQLFPESWEETDSRRHWIKMIGRRVDVMWANGRITTDFAENSLEVVSEER